MTTQDLISPISSKSQFSSLAQNPAGNSPVNRSSKNSSLYSDRIKHFLSDPNDAPPYGYQDNTITGIGFWMMEGARFAISVYKRGDGSSFWFNRTTLKLTAFAIAFLTSPFTIVGAALKAIGSQFPHKVENLTSDKIRKTAAHHVDQIYELLKIVDTLLRENHINYSMDGGTLLGAIRHKGIIPWDDDGDIIMMQRDKARFLALRDKLKGKGVILQDTGMNAFKLTFDAATLKEQFGTTTREAANLDIFIVAEDHDGKIRPESDYFKHLFPKEYFIKDELQDLRDYPFGPLEKGLFLKGPSSPMRYLSTFYGPECFEYALQTHSHIQLGPFSFPTLNFSKTKYKIINPTFAEGNIWKNS
jgi:hypothetical protein